MRSIGPWTANASSKMAARGMAVRDPSRAKGAPDAVPAPRLELWNTELNVKMMPPRSQHLGKARGVLVEQSLQEQF